MCVWRIKVVTSCCHGSKNVLILTNYGRKKMKKWQVWISCAWYPLRNKMVAHTFLPLFDTAGGCLCQERLFKSRNSATIVTWHHTFPLYLQKDFYCSPPFPAEITRPTHPENKSNLKGTFVRSPISKKQLFSVV